MNDIEKKESTEKYDGKTSSVYGIDVEKQPGDKEVTVDAVWGTMDGNGPNYRNLGWCVVTRCC